MKVELITGINNEESCKITHDNGTETIYNLKPNEALLVGLIIGLQDEVTELSKKIK